MAETLISVPEICKNQGIQRVRKILPDPFYRVFIKYCVFFRFFKNIPDSGLSLFSLSVCTHTWQIENQRCSKAGRVQKNHKILRKSTIFNEHPVYPSIVRVHMAKLPMSCSSACFQGCTRSNRIISLETNLITIRHTSLAIAPVRDKERKVEMEQ